MFLQIKITREKLRWIGTGALVILTFTFLTVLVTAILAVVLRID
jgi:hypothetical protein